jgi:outer membrane protein TolC
VFDAGRIRANIALQTARQEELLAAYEGIILQAFQEVEDALVAYAREQIRRDDLARAVQANQRAAELAQQLYAQGLTDFLSVLDAERSLFISQDALAQSQRDVALNLVALYKAVGGGWEVEAQTAPIADTASSPPIASSQPGTAAGGESVP